VSNRDAAFLARCFDGLYEACGRGALTCSDDAIVVFLHEFSRRCGVVVHELDDLSDGREGVFPLPVITQVLDEALAYDPGGLLALYAISMVLGPRLLISLRDVVTEHADTALREICQAAASTLVTQLRHLATIASARGPVHDQEWQGRATSFTTLLENEGYAESFVRGTK